MKCGFFWFHLSSQMAFMGDSSSWMILEMGETGIDLFIEATLIWLQEPTVQGQASTFELCDANRSRKACCQLFSMCWFSFFQCPKHRTHWPMLFLVLGDLSAKWCMKQMRHTVHCFEIKHHLMLLCFSSQIVKFLEWQSKAVEVFCYFFKFW